MPHIALPEGLPGITGGFAFRPETAKPMRELAHVLLHGPSMLTPGERELIATYISSQNDCYFCQTSHGAAAAAHLKDSGLVDQIKRDFLQSLVSDKLKALLVIAGQVQWQPQDPKMYSSMGKHLASHGYVTPSMELVP